MIRTHNTGRILPNLAFNKKSGHENGSFPNNKTNKDFVLIGVFSNSGRPFDA